MTATPATLLTTLPTMTGVDGGDPEPDPDPLPDSEVLEDVVPDPVGVAPPPIPPAPVEVA